LGPRISPHQQVQLRKVVAREIVAQSKFKAKREKTARHASVLSAEHMKGELGGNLVSTGTAVP
jgi:hypothetical protein